MSQPPPSALAALPSIAATIRKAGLAADRRLGQHFLVDPAILAKIARAAGELDGCRAIEIGPGPGGLTRALLGAGAASVVAIERDPRCIEVLAPLQRASEGRLQLVEGDALAIDLVSLIEGPTVIVANLPYNIASELIVRWLTSRLAVRSIVVLVQREVGARLQAQTGTQVYGRLAVIAQWCAKVEGVFDLPPGAFMPPPKVHSRLIRLEPHPHLRADVPLAILSRVTAAAFGQRRKMLKTSLKNLTREPLDLLDRCGIDPTWRAERLTVDQFGQLAAAYHSGTSRG